MKWVHFIFSHSIFIALCAVALCFQTALLLKVNLNIYLHSFVFFSTVCSYNFYWLLSSFSFGKMKMLDYIKFHFSNAIVFAVTFVGMAGSVFYLPQLFASITMGILLTFLYFLPILPIKSLYPLRKAGLFKTLLLAFTWAYVTVYLPSSLAGALQHEGFLLLFINRFLFMLILCIIFDNRDIAVDKIRGLQSLATILKPSLVKLIVAFLFIAYIINSFLFTAHFKGANQIIPLKVTIIVTGLATAIVYFFSIKKQSYFFYYFLVDGLMLFSAIATYITHIVLVLYN